MLEPITVFRAETKFKLSYYLNDDQYRNGRPPKGMVLLLPGFTSVKGKYGHVSPFTSGIRGRAASEQCAVSERAAASLKSMDILESSKQDWMQILDTLKRNGQISDDVYAQCEELYSVTATVVDEVHTPPTQTLHRQVRVVVIPKKGSFLCE